MLITEQESKTGTESKRVEPIRNYATFVFMWQKRQFRGGGMFPVADLA